MEATREKLEGEGSSIALPETMKTRLRRIYVNLTGPFRVPSFGNSNYTIYFEVYIIIWSSRTTTTISMG